MGYTQIEGYEHDKLSIFWGMKNTGTRLILVASDTSELSTHCNINKTLNGKAGEAAEIGMKYLICPESGDEDMNKSIFKAAALFLMIKIKLCK